MTALTIPPAALEDKNSFEILRVWAANEEQHVSISSDLNDTAEDFGFMLAQLAYHGSNLYSQRFKKSKEETLKQILDGFYREIKENTGNSTGAIGH